MLVEGILILLHLLGWKQPRAWYHRLKDGPWFYGCFFFSLPLDVYVLLSIGVGVGNSTDISPILILLAFIGSSPSALFLAVPLWLLVAPMPLLKACNANWSRVAVPGVVLDRRFDEQAEYQRAQLREMHALRRDLSEISRELARTQRELARQRREETFSGKSDAWKWQDLDADRE